MELLHASERIARIAENPLPKNEQGQRRAAEPMLILLRRFAIELAREKARMLCDEVMAEEAIALIRHDLIAA